MNESQHRIAKEVRVLAIIEPPRHFIQVGLQVFCGNFMPRANDAALQKRERGFDRVRVNVGSESDVFLFGMVDGLMLGTWHSSLIHGKRIGGKVVSHDHINVRADVLADVFRQCARLRIFRMEESQVATALTDADHNLFCLFASVNTPADLFAAYAGLIYFDRAIQFRSGDLLDRMAYAMTEIPCGSVIDSQHSLQLIRAHALPGLAHDVGSKEPFGQRQVRIVKDRASSHGELIAA